MGYVSEPLVSILMNCYNGEKYLAKSLRSVIEQDYTNWELIFWDNQSTDRSAEIVRSFSEKKIRYYFSKQHTDLGAARVNASKLVRGEWIAVLDVDDYWLRDNLAVKLGHGEIDRNVGIIYSRYFVDRSEVNKNSYIGPRCRTLPAGRQYRNLLLRNFVGLSTALYRRSAFDHVDGFSSYSITDYCTALKISKSFEIMAVDKATSVYRVHKNNYSRAKFNKIMEEREIIGNDLPDQSSRELFRIGILLDTLKNVPNPVIISSTSVQISNILTLRFIRALLSRLISRIVYEVSRKKRDHSRIVKEFLD